MKTFVREEVEPLDLVFDYPGAQYDVKNKRARAAIQPLRKEVKRQGLWACHLGPEHGGRGYGQVKLGLMNEILGRTVWGPTVFGTAAPDTGNSEILARFGTPAQKDRFLKPLLDGEIVSCYSMTEPQGGGDPGVFTTRAVRDGDHWVINGEKWFSSQAQFAAFFIVMAVTDTQAGPHKGMSMFLVPAETPGIRIVRGVGMIGDGPDEGTHGYVRYENVRVPVDAVLGEEGGAFKVAQARLGGGRLHHAMRTIGVCNRAFEMMCERAVSRQTKGSRLADKQAVQTYVADSHVELQQFRLLVLHAAWVCDQGDEKAMIEAIAGVKIATPKIYHDIVQRAVHVHGSLGASNEMPLARWWMKVPAMGIMDGPTEVHRFNLAKQLLRSVKPATGLFPSEHLIGAREAARRKLTEYIENQVEASA